LAELGRRLAASTCKTAKHCIKRAWRFTSNERTHISEAMQGPLRWLVRQRRYWKKRPLVVEHGLDEGAVVPHADAGHAGAWAGLPARTLKRGKPRWRSLSFSHWFGAAWVASVPHV
jgi:hypothetical protein